MTSVRSVSTRWKEKRAFTLIELIVAIGVTMLLVTLMLSIVTNVLKGWGRSTGALTAGAEARLMLDQIERDLAGAIMKRDGNVWMAATIQGTQTTTGDTGVSDAIWSGLKAVPKSLLIPDPAALPFPKIEDYSFGHAGVWLRFFTTPPDNSTVDVNNLSAPRAVAYQIIRLPVVANGNEIRYQFFRSEVRPGHATPATARRSTFGQGYNLFDATATYNLPSATNSGDAEPGGLRRPDRSRIIGNNVVDFGIRFFRRDTAGALSLVFPSATTKRGFAATVNDGTNSTTAAVPPAPASGPLSAAQFDYGFPAVAEVVIRILTEEGAAMIENLEAGRTTGDWWTIVEANSHVYSRRIEMKGAAF